MLELVILFTFFGLLIVGSLIADAAGVLPSADELQAQDAARNARDQRLLDGAE